MITMTIRTKLMVSAIALALGITAICPGAAVAQNDPAADSVKQAEARAAMEAAADSARKAAESRAAGARKTPPPPPDTSKPAVSDSAAAEGAAKAAGDVAGATVKTLETLGEAAGKSVPDTSGKPSIGGLKGDTAAGQTGAASTPAEGSEPQDPSAPYKNVTFAPDEKPLVVIETTMGKIVVELWPDVAPKSCQNFVYLAERGFYDSLLFHRVVPGFLIQGGDPLGTGMGKPGYIVPAELSSAVLHEEGVLSMARLSDPAAKGGAPEKPEFLNSAGSQFFICLDRAASLDGKYTAFGKVIEGLDVVHKIAKTPAQRERPVAAVYMTKVYLQQKS